MSAEPRIEVHPDADTLAHAVAGELLDRIHQAQASGHVPQICLTGGTIAEAIHRQIAVIADASGVDWGAVDFWWGDERFVSADSPDRNEGQARAAFLDALGVPAHRIHAMPSTDDVADVDAAAAAFEQAVREHGSGGFDLLMLGVGPDAHIASLFPHHPDAALTDHIAVAVHDSPKPPPERISFTFEALARSRSVWFLVSGEGKADAVAAALADPTPSRVDVPAAGVRGEDETVWFLDRDAASRL
ncbi:6-phosphogluconolactonase [Nocardioides fonticola]|uniref:6-phosphogluconolactonase n=1 Tax=Nocardioides fonticola TaxID=450363 RepID=A0ABP7XTQ8_9ACTN